MKAHAEQESWWVLRAQAGDREALDALLRSVEAPLSRYVARLVGERAAAEDILQEVFIQIYRKLRWLREPELFRPWAYRIASREAFRRLKRERRRAEQLTDAAVLETIPAPTPREEFAPEWQARLPQLLAAVSPASRAVIVLHYLEEMTLVEVADVLGVAHGTVKSRLAYGLETLRRAIGAQDGAARVAQKKETR